MPVYPYEQISWVWNSECLIGKAYMPRLAQSAWINVFRGRKLLSVLHLTGSDPNVTRTEGVPNNGWRDVVIT